MTTKTQTNVLRKELEAEEKATRKAEAMELLRQVSAKSVTVEKQLREVERKKLALDELRAEIYEAYEEGNAFGIEAARNKLTQLGF